MQRMIEKKIKDSADQYFIPIKGRIQSCRAQIHNILQVIATKVDPQANQCPCLSGRVHALSKLHVKERDATQTRPRVSTARFVYEGQCYTATILIADSCPLLLAFALSLLSFAFSLPQVNSYYLFSPSRHLGTVHIRFISCSWLSYTQEIFRKLEHKARCFTILLNPLLDMPSEATLSLSSVQASTQRATTTAANFLVVPHLCARLQPHRKRLVSAFLTNCMFSVSSIVDVFLYVQELGVASDLQIPSLDLCSM